MMAPQDLESELTKAPFQPFRIVTTNGKTYEITARDRPLILVGKRTVIIGLRLPETDPYFDRYEVVSLVHIIRFEPIAISHNRRDGPSLVPAQDHQVIPQNLNRSRSASFQGCSSSSVRSSASEWWLWCSSR